MLIPQLQMYVHPRSILQVRLPHRAIYYTRIMERGLTRCLEIGGVRILFPDLNPYAYISLEKVRHTPPRLYASNEYLKEKKLNITLAACYTGP